MVKILQMLAVSLILVCSSGAARAGGYEDGLAAVHRGDYATALRLLSPLAQKGLAEAQFGLGDMYLGGHGVAQDNKKAVKWYRLAADQGLAPAQLNLGDMYLGVHGVAQDDKEAVRWYRLAADQRLAQAQNNLGAMYRYGVGVAQDDKEAVMWYLLAADQGLAKAQHNLGIMYNEGLGIAQNYVYAHMWLNIAAASLSGDERGKTTSKLELVSKNMTSAQIEQAQEMARACQESNFKNCD